MTGSSPAMRPSTNSIPALLNPTPRTREVGSCEPAEGRSHSHAPGRLHGLLDHGQQLDLQGVQIDLLAEPGRERLGGAGGVVAAPVAAAALGLARR